jgi:hypothetical protein
MGLRRVGQLPGNAHCNWHIGVVIAGFRLLDAMRKQPSHREFDDTALSNALRSGLFMDKLSSSGRSPTKRQISH